ncbi:MAG TPA: AI-2E family transporter [Thermomicrobiales bacterium]|nr:AI-2E family transporter [Thermomicrobiales bacterium]
MTVAVAVGEPEGERRPIAIPPPGVPGTTQATEPADRRERRGGLGPISLLLTLFVAYLLYQVQLLVILTLLAVVFATAIERPVHLLETRRLPRPAGILVVYAAIVGGLVLLFSVLAPVIQEQLALFREQAPDQLRQLQAAWAASPNAILNGPGQDLLRRGIDVVANPAEVEVPLPGDAAIGVITGVGGAIVSFLTVFVIAFYYLMEKAWLRRLILLELPPDSRARVGRVWENVEHKVGDWLRGQLILCLVIGVLATVGYGAMGIRFWPLLGLWAGLTEIIPILGPWLGAVPAVIIALTQAPEKALLVGLFAAGLQLLENTILVPRIMREAVGLTPMTVFLAILAGTQFLGVVGALLAIPFAAAVQVVLTDYLATRREANRAGMPVPGWRWMRGSAVPTITTSTPAVAPPAPSAAPAPARPPSAASPRHGWSADLLARLGGAKNGDEAGR